MSTTRRLPLGAKARCRGTEKAAAVPMPSTEEYTPDPANVVTTAAGVIILMRPESLTNTFAALSTAIPSRSLKEALVPTPFKAPELPDPARVETAPEGIILLMRQLERSATYIIPAESIARAKGLLKPPAKVVMAPTVVMRWTRPLAE